jgi:hypothetical protein
MNQAKPVPPPKQKRAYIADVSHACQGKCPCGAKCALDGSHRHRFHTCANKECQRCHADARFGRIADPLPRPEGSRPAAGWAK